MDCDRPIDWEPIARALGLVPAQVAATVKLLDGGNTVPFITRYRKDQTGGLDEEEIRRVEQEVSRRRQLAERKQTICRSIESQGKLTPQLARQIDEADNIKRVEDLYLPYKPKKQTRATLARQRGLAPLAAEIETANSACDDLDHRAADFVDPDREVATAADALLGAGHLLAERFSERADVRQLARRRFRDTGTLVCAKADQAGEQAQRFRDYFDFRAPIGRVPPHRVLAINRGERAKVLRVRIESDVSSIQEEAEKLLVAFEHPHRLFLTGCVRDAIARLILPSLERELRRELTDQAEQHAVTVFAQNLRNLLLQPPLPDRRVLAIDPGFKSGCKLAALDEFGNLLAHDLIHLVGSEERRKLGREKLVELIRRHAVTVVAIGNGTACRETEELLAELIADELHDADVSYVVVNEAGASVYSASSLGREELPQYDATVRGAVSIGRRLQDPLSELVKIDPASIGVGLYQHDVKDKYLRESLDRVVESCVNFVGVDLNASSPALLRYVSGLNALTARRVYDYRVEHGPFRRRQDLMAVPGVGEAAFVQAAGFLKIAAGEIPLDSTWIHPESYAAARQVLGRLNATEDSLHDPQSAAALATELSQWNADGAAEELDLGAWLLKDIVESLSRPGRDPREDLAPPIFRKGVVKLDDLSVGMELRGTVLNVVDFGAFVDIGLSDSGLVHISQLSPEYLRDPHQVVAVGNAVQVWVRQIDKERRRVSLTMIPPGTEPPIRSPRGIKKPARPAAAPAAVSGSQSPKKGDRTTAVPKPKRHRPSKPSPRIPISEAMVEGTEPMRTFGDLAQFYEKRRPDGV